jgi:hypothetical protein
MFLIKTFVIFFSFFFKQYWGLNSGPSPWATPPALFFLKVFQDTVSETICLGWLRTAILLIFASWVARIIGMRHHHLAIFLTLPFYPLSWGCSTQTFFPIFVVLKSRPTRNSSICLLSLSRLSRIRTSLTSLRQPLKLVPHLLAPGGLNKRKQKISCLLCVQCVLYIYVVCNMALYSTWKPSAKTLWLWKCCHDLEWPNYTVAILVMMMLGHIRSASSSYCLGMTVINLWLKV